MKHALLLAVCTLAACGPGMRAPRPIMTNGAILSADADRVVDRAAAHADAERPAMPVATGGELALGMTEAQVLAATGTTPDAWQTRGDGRTRVLAARTLGGGPSDAVAEVAYVTLQDGRVRSYAYREPQGVRTVDSPADATSAGRRAAQAEALLREGDALALNGAFTAALERFDRADVVRPGDGETTLRIATALDKLLRPVEAELRYRRALQQLEIERLRAEGEVAARIAEAIARAHERIVVLERR